MRVQSSRWLPPPPPPSREPLWLLSWPLELLLLDEPEGDDELENGPGELDEENDCGALAGVAVVVGCGGPMEAALLGAAVEPAAAAPE